MDVEIIRRIVANAYPGTSWKKKVNEMSENQVIAIYYNLKKSDKVK